MNNIEPSNEILNENQSNINENNSNQEIIDKTTNEAKITSEIAGENTASEGTEKSLNEEVKAQQQDSNKDIAMEENAEKKSSEEDIRLLRKKHREEVYRELEELKEKNSKISVYVKARIRGGLRVIYKEVPLFLPASHFSLKKTPSEIELQDSIGRNIDVLIHEIQDQENGKAVIVSRKKLIEDMFWNKVQVGDIIEGPVTSVANFGVFVDIGGFEGLIHISRLSNSHIKNPKDLFKKGDIIRAVIIELDRENNKIALSRKEIEDSPWKNVDIEFHPDSEHEAIVKRFTDFGAYLELKPGVDGLLRISEISWTLRPIHPSELLKINQKIKVKVLAINPEKQTITLSHKRTMPSPWQEIKENYPIGTEYEGTIRQILKQGAIVRINENLDGFMPKSKMKDLLKAKNNKLSVGEKINVVIADIVPEDESLILAPQVELNLAPVEKKKENISKKPKKQQSKPVKEEEPSQNKGSFTLLDLLSDKEKSTLLETISKQ